MITPLGCEGGLQLSDTEVYPTSLARLVTAPGTKMIFATQA